MPRAPCSRKTARTPHACTYKNYSCDTYPDRPVLGLLLCTEAIAWCCAVLCCAVQCCAVLYSQFWYSAIITYSYTLLLLCTGTLWKRPTNSLGLHSSRVSTYKQNSKLVFVQHYQRYTGGFSASLWWIEQKSATASTTKPGWRYRYSPLTVTVYLLAKV